MKPVLWEVKHELVEKKQTNKQTKKKKHVQIQAKETNCWLSTITVKREEPRAGTAEINIIPENRNSFHVYVHSVACCHFFSRRTIHNAQPNSRQKQYKK